MINTGGGKLAADSLASQIGGKGTVAITQANVNSQSIQKNIYVSSC